MEESDTGTESVPGDEDIASSEPADEDDVVIEDEDDDDSTTDPPDEEVVPIEDDSNGDEQESEDSESDVFLFADNDGGITIDAGNALGSDNDSITWHFADDEFQLVDSNEGYLSAGEDSDSDSFELSSDSDSTGLQEGSTITAGNPDNNELTFRIEQ